MINGLLVALIPSEFLRAILSLISGITAGFFAAWLLVEVISRVVGAVDGRFALWYAYRSGRFKARGYDHRIWMMGVGLVAFGLTVILFAITPAQFQPTINEDNSRIQIEVVPGTTLEQTEKIADRVSDLMYAQPEVERALTRVRETNATVFVSRSIARTAENSGRPDFVPVTKRRRRDRTRYINHADRFRPRST